MVPEAVRNRSLLYTATFIRALATSMAAVLLGLYLAELQLDAAQIGSVVGVGLAGAAVATLVVTLAGDRLGRRRALVSVALLGVAGTTVVVFASHPLTITVAAFLGMLNGMGRDRGASLVLEQAILPATTTDTHRTRAFAWYNVLQDAGHALGSLLAALPSLLQRSTDLGELASLRIGVAVYPVLILITALLCARLSAAVESAPTERRRRVSPECRRVLWRISSLFALDAVGGGFLTTTLLTLFFHERFAVSASAIGAIFFGARVANAGSHLAASWLATRIGLVNTMVFTHIPSSLLLVTVAIAPNFPVAVILFLLRESLVEMDVPTRQSYVMAVVRDDERTIASGVTHLVRMGGWAVAPFFAGAAMKETAMATPLVVGAAMKIAYDIMLYLAFRGTKPPEERRF